VLRSRKSRLLPAPELEDPITFCIDFKTDYGKLACEGLFKMLTIPALDVKNTLLIRWRVPPMSNLVRY
jgi:hypothetical protein